MERAWPSRRVHDSVGLAEKLDESLVFRPVDLECRLAGVPNSEAKRVALWTEWHHEAKRVATLGFDLDHLRTKVGEDAARHRCRLASQVDHFQPGEQRVLIAGHGRTVFGRAGRSHVGLVPGAGVVGDVRRAGASRRRLR